MTLSNRKNCNLGVAKGSSRIVPYTADWPLLFNIENNILNLEFKDYFEIFIEHIGSTSIPGLASKPIIDIVMGIDWVSFNVAKSKLESLNYKYRGTPHELSDHVFLKGGDFRTHALHLVEYQSKVWVEKLFFRDQLRKNAKLAKEYEELKGQLANKFANDRRSYTKGKSDFILNVLRQKNIERV